MRVNVDWRPGLLECAVIQHEDAVAHAHRFFLVMRHKYGGHGQGTGDSFNFAAHGFTQLSVKRRERFVKENNFGA